MHDNLRSASDALSRSINAQAEHWMRVGMLAELHPALCYGDICQMMLRAAQSNEPGLSFVKEAPRRPAGRPLRRAAR